MRFAPPPRAAKQRAPKMKALGDGVKVTLTIIDFEQRFPSALEQAIATASSGAA